ncbi:polyprenyl synthetase family protein [Streptomyces sp. SB3404]|uniref:Polyprenyl synthetase family protein n=2 Tax=Streptomyces boncukensis TaxID=2711219 RepID=A0A6G4WSS3_9ACTN|nr:polyprenyl synthetase family protein [Streptomyces boncukensis]
MPVSSLPQSQESAPAWHLLGRALELTAPALRGGVGRLPREMRVLAGYHLGWLDEHGRTVNGPALGKVVRPALVYASCEAVGGSAKDAIGAAVAVELVHNFSLVHDDVIDRDELRRHRPTVWRQFGIPAALLGGDAMLTLALHVLADTPDIDVSRAVQVLAHATLELIEGEAMDTAFEQRSDVTVAEYVAMAGGKTGALMWAACTLGALAGGAERGRIHHLARFGRHVGLAFQITDDLLGLYGDAKVTGKPVGRDLATRKKTYPVLAAMATDTTAGQKLAAMYARLGPLDDPLVPQAVLLIEESGGRRAAEQAAAQELQRAFAALTEAVPEPRAAADLKALAHLMAHRAT